LPRFLVYIEVRLGLEGMERLTEEKPFSSQRIANIQMVCCDQVFGNWREFLDRIARKSQACPKKIHSLSLRGFDV